MIIVFGNLSVSSKIFTVFGIRFVHMPYVVWICSDASFISDTGCLCFLSFYTSLTRALLDLSESQLLALYGPFLVH